MAIDKSRHIMPFFQILNKNLVRVCVCVAIFAWHCQTDRPNQNSQNTLNVRLANEPGKLNPFLTNESNALQVMGQLFQPLLDVDPKTLQLVPVLAKSRAIVRSIDTGALKGGKSYTFEIRENARWDNGAPITAADYEFTLKTILNPYVGANNYRSTIDFISKITIDPNNPRRFTISTNQKYILAEENLSTIPVLSVQNFDPAGLMSKFSVENLMAMLKDSNQLAQAGQLQKFAEQFTNPKFSRSSEGVVGSGAYKLKEWATGQRIVLVRKENWWADTLHTTNPMFSAFPDRLVYRFVSEEPTLVSLLKDNKIDATHRLSSKTFLELKNDSTMKLRYQFNVVPTLGFGYVGFNTKNPKFVDKRVRRAFAHLVDVDLIINQYLSGLAEPCIGPFAPSRSYYNRKLSPIKLDIEKAATLFKESGWADSDNDGILDKTIEGKKVKLEVRFCFPTGNANAKSIGLILSENAKKVGVKVVSEAVDGEVFQEKMKQRDFELFASAFTPPPFIDDPKEIWSTSSDKPDGNNRFGFGNKKSDQLIEQIRTELDSTKRHALYLKFQEIVYDEQPAIFVFSPQEKAILSKKFVIDSTIIKKPGYIEGRMKKKQ